MAWYRNAVDLLRACNPAEVTHRGNSMTGRIADGQIATIMPLGDRSLCVGDLVFAYCEGNYIIREIGEIKDFRFRITDRTGHTVGWCNWPDVLGVVSRVADPPIQNTG